jgi:hypothetical protein
MLLPGGCRPAESLRSARLLCHSMLQLLIGKSRIKNRLQRPVWIKRLPRRRIPAPLTAMGRISLFRGEGGKVWNPALRVAPGAASGKCCPTADFQIASDLTLRVLTVPPVPQMIAAGPLRVM